MLIEYKIKFEKAGVTITQRVEPGSSGAIVTSAAADPPPPPAPNAGDSKALPQAFSAPHAVSPAKPALGTGPAKADKGGGDVAPTDTGEGGVGGSGLTIIFGPIVISGTALGDTGGGDVAPTDTGENPQ
jgi:hypothetical protein